MAFLNQTGISMTSIMTPYTIQLANLIIRNTSLRPCYTLAIRRKQFATIMDSAEHETQWGSQ